MTTTSMETSSALYAVVDLGSNSFHMLITRQLADSVQVVDRVKRKVRLAAGLNSDNILSEQAMAKGLECLSFFAERLQDIPKNNIRIVATATLRLAVNRADFITKAELILGHSISLLSGIAEAEHYHKNIEKIVTKTGICPGTGKTITHTASVNESHYMSPLSESYWSM